MSPVLLAAMLILVAEADHPPTVVVLAVGAAGAPEYGEDFHEWAERWALAADRAGAGVVRVGENSARETPDKQRLEEVLSEQPRQSPASLWLVLIGHGTFDGHSAKFNLRGEDVSAAELGEWLRPFERPVVVINCSSSSAPYINRLSAPNRVVVTATRSGYELNYARFGDHLSAALGDSGADLDKDGQTSLLEAFLSASGRVAEFYDQEARLRTETALIDDNGDGRGTPADWFRGIHATRRATEGALLDGSRAHQLHLIPSPAERDMSQEVRARRDRLELEIARLRQAKGTTPDEDEYYSKLEPLLVELAHLYADLERPEDGGAESSSQP